MSQHFPQLTSVTLQQARAARARRARHGDSLLEVMIALAVASIGVVGLASMQGATARSNQDSQETTIAISFAKTWLERIKRDALGWTAAMDPSLMRTNVLAGRNTGLAFSDNYFVPTPPADDDWAVPVPLHAAESSGANNRGIDVGAPNVALPGQPIVANRDIHYCVNVNFVTTQNATDGLTEKMLATVRVWWTRRASLEQTNYSGIALDVRGAAGCAARLPTAAELASPDMRVLYLSAPIRFTSSAI